MPEEDNNQELEQQRASMIQRAQNAILAVKKVKTFWAFLLANPWILVGIATLILLIFIILIAIVSLESENRSETWGAETNYTLQFEAGQSLCSRVHGALLAVLGLTREQAAGMMGNIRAESGFSPFRQEDARTWPNGGWGLIQWTGGRRRHAETFVRERVGAAVFHRYYRPEYGVAGAVNNIPEEVVNAFIVAQVELIQHEFENAERRAAGRLRATATIEAASDSVMNDFLRPAERVQNAIRRRAYSHEAVRDCPPAVAINVGTGELAEGWGRPLADMRCTSGFGLRRHPIYGDMRMHNGIDLSGVPGTPIFAVASGSVTFAGLSGSLTRGCGWAVRITHDDGWSSFYCHMRDRPMVSVSSRVTQGQQIGVVGSTGSSTGPHLHLEIFNASGNRVDPAPIFGVSC